MDLLVLMFVTGFALATLIFWPLLHRANRRLANSEAVNAAAAPVGKHALRTRPAPPTPKVVARRPKTDEQTDAQATPDEPKTEPELAPAIPVAPQQRLPEQTELPTLPTDLFEKHFEAKFNRSRQRLAKIRDEIAKE